MRYHPSIPSAFVLTVAAVVPACPGDGGSQTTAGSTTASTGGVQTSGSSNAEDTATADDSATAPTGPTTAASDTSATSDTSSTSSTGGTGGTNETSGSSGPAVSASTGDSSGEGTASSSGTDGTDSEGDTDGGTCCEPGCSSELFATHVGQVAVKHSGTRIASLDQGKHLALWAADTLDRVLTRTAVDEVALVGDTLVYRQGAELHVLDADDGAPLGVCASDKQWGLARDGTYLWTAGAGGIEVLELDCGLRWSVGGDLGDAKVLATAGAVNVYDVDLMPQSVVHLDALDGGQSSDAFVGAFANWFADAPRYWTTQGASYRIYDLDNTEVKLAPGAVQYGWDMYIVSGSGVQSIYAPGTLAQLKGEYVISGPAALSLDTSGAVDVVSLVRLDQDPPTTEVVTPACCVREGGKWKFAFADGAWAVGGASGYASDHLARPITAGQVVGLAGAKVGRVAVGVVDGDVHVYDIGGDCGIFEHPTFSRDDGELWEGADLLWMASDGSRLVSRESYRDWPLQLNALAGTRFYALPGGALEGAKQTSINADVIVDHEVSDDGSMYARLVTNMLWSYSAGFAPAGPALAGDSGNVIPRFAPGGAHMVVSDAKPFPNDWGGAFTQISTVAPKKLVAVTAGIPIGFLDDERILVGHYTGVMNPKFVGSDIVDLAGVVVQATTLPDIRGFVRVGTGEILAQLHPNGDAAIFDPVTGDQLWTAPPGTDVVLAGTDLVVVGDGAFVTLVKWR